MIEKKVLINTIDKVTNFVFYFSAFAEGVTVRSGEITVDGKSILGLMSLDLSRVLTVYIEPIDEKSARRFEACIEEFEVKE